ncbi:hypothetical protein QQM39_25170 [Streptomyces sp. DT2A-34]|uniref:hypothetical protein n=1 Tax=Streptomyces sp. DT2A-34 TaxID=3051182 RepID=UPI00265C03C8|nr:hypothetical protein [Streptomyces sp. DT2A-34]MDO0913999.1 hypothetical protein [Streptomyces sp. DT2A-34]
MGDHFQAIVDLGASPQQAPQLAERVVEWLVAEGIVLAELTDCVLGQPLGHPPGPNWQRAVAPDDADADPWDGLAVYTGRTVFHGGQGGPEAVTCPRCGVTTRLITDEWDLINDVWVPFGLAIDVWHKTGTAQVDCPACTRPVPLPDWAWADDYFAFAHLGFEFWNWPPFTEEFRTRISELLDGHRTAYVWGKL